ncbi:MAG: CHAD domain-containing protein [Rubrimonas sp.]|uniref:CYTH and CHAD domain-containing protein n=1 Tax=Rubrimonas sp. TaxID=2036015 RepID=UPI002FDDF4CA
MTTEIELKLLLDAATEKALRAAAASAPLTSGKPSRIRLKAVYFDTPDRALSRRRIALRVRREGRRWVQTVKLGSGVIAGLSRPLEDEQPAPGGRLALHAIGDVALREAVLDALDGAQPVPVFETDIQRSLWLLQAPRGGSVELAVDVGEIRAGERAAHLREAELELKSGQAAELFELAKALWPPAPLRASRRNKAERGFALAAGGEGVRAVPEPVQAAPVILARALTAEQAARDVLRLCLDQIMGNVAATAFNDAPEGPHQLRVGLRRLRTAVSVFAPILDVPALRALDAEARDLAACVGAVRDLDVLMEEVAIPAPGAPADPGFAALHAALAGRRDVARKAARARLAEPRTAGFVFDLGGFVEGRGWLRPDDISQTAELAQPVAHLAAAALDKRWRKAAKLGARIEELEGEARHDLRKALKKLRYAAEFFAPLFKVKPTAAFIRTLKTLQDDFGALQDMAMAEAALTGPDAPAAADPAAQRAVGRVLATSEARAEAHWSHAKRDWRALSEARKFWRED